MIFALDNAGRRVMPTISGQRANCPHCGHSVIAKCGDIYMWHWQHATGQLCDPWKEHETAWHREWKSKFPPAWQEVIIRKGDEKHVADVRTSAGLVIEFQNSSIAPSTIRIREDFYENMIWVVNASHFESNLTFKSIVSRKLRELEEDPTPYTDRIEKETKALMKEIDDLVIKANTTIESVKRSITNQEQKKQKITGCIQDAVKLSSEIIDCWKSNKVYYNFSMNAVIDPLKVHKSDIERLSDEARSLDQELSNTHEQLKYLDDLPAFCWNEIIYKIVPYSVINKSNYNRFSALQKQSASTLFPSIIPITNETTFQQYQFKQHEYNFIIDPAATYKRLQETLQLVQQKVKHNSAEQKAKEEIIQAEAIRLLTYELEKINQELVRLEETEQAQRDILTSLLKRRQSVSDVKAKEIIDAQVADEKEKSEQKFSVMKKFKKQYYFEWKYERKSWKSADCRLYFDLGNGFLFEKLSDSKVQKILVNEFVEEMRRGNY